MVLSTFSRRTLTRRLWQTVLMVLGIALGVAVVVAVDLANASAARAFDYSTGAVAGRATHQIVAGPQGMDERIYVRLRREGVVDAAAPVVTAYATSPQLGGRPFQLLGVDPFAELPFRSYLGAEGGVPVERLVEFLTEPGAVLLSVDVATRYGIEPGVELTLAVEGYERTVRVAGLAAPADELSRRALEGLVLADVATAQELTGRVGRLDHVDLILEGDGQAEAARIARHLPDGTRVVTVQAREGAIEQMTAAFRVNLTALSLLALVVGLFLIYNAMTFSVVQRRALFGTLRCLGVTRRELFTLVLGEALAIGVLGSALGMGLGVVLGRGTVRLITQTINDLYFVVTVRDVAIPLSSLVKGGVAGVVATALAAALPAWEAASVPPRTALSRSGLESTVQRVVRGAALGGLALLAAGAGLLLVPSRSLVLSFAGTSAVIVGCALLTPSLARVLMRAGAPLLGRLGGVLGRLAPRSTVNALSRTAVAIAALMIAVAAVIGIRLMIGSFRHTVDVWMSQMLRGDVYISVASLAGTQNFSPIEPGVVDQVAGWPGVARVDRLRFAAVDSPAGRVQIAGIDNPRLGHERVFVPGSAPPEAIWPALQEGAVIVSEPFARRVGLEPRGDEVTLYTARGTHTFPVAGVYYDYTTSEGIVSMSLDTYRRLWEDDRVTALALRLEPGVGSDGVTRALQDGVASEQQLAILPNRALREEVLVVFDRTFAITGALQVLATAVAFIGVLSALLSLQLDKQRELGILRAVGLTVRQLWGLTMVETGLLGGVAGLLSLPVGFVLALILVYVINRRAFGWTLLLQVDPLAFVQAMAIAVGAALLAGIYPAYRLGRMAAAEALRFE
jgi:putative ABC transport system permease protein